MHCSLAFGEIILCYLALISSHLYALQPSHWRVHCMLFSLHFELFVCIAAEPLESSLYVI